MRRVLSAEVTGVRASSQPSALSLTPQRGAPLTAHVRFKPPFSYSILVTSGDVTLPSAVL